MDIDQRLRQAYENEDNPPPPPMDPALMASPDDQMLQPALPTARPEPLYGGEPSISNREELTTREKLQRLTEQVGVEYFGLDERNAVDFGKTIWGAGADDVGAPGAVEGLGFADLIGADLIFMLEEGYNRLQRGSVMGDRGDVAQGIAEIGIGAISAIPGGKAAVRVGEQIIRGPVKDFYEEAIERWQAGKSPIPVGMSIEDVFLKAAPEGSRAHKLPHQILISGDGKAADVPVTQAFSAANKQANMTAIDTVKANNPQALLSERNWAAAQQSALGGDFLPAPPSQAIKYANDPQAIADKISLLTPELKDGVDRGFAHVQELRNLYETGLATEEMTGNLFTWGILSRGAGPVQQEAAFIDIQQAAAPYIKAAIDGKFDKKMLSKWEKQIGKSGPVNNLPEGSPARQVTMNVNAAGKLLMALSQKTDDGQSVLSVLHNMMSDSSQSGPAIRRKFMELTDKAGIDNKVVSFIMLVSGRDDVLVMDRIQSRHLWDDGRYKGFNIYDGYVKEGTTAKEGLHGVMRGPRGLLLTEMLEDGLRDSVAQGYKLAGRDGEGSLGRFHWESWVIEGEQVVDHSTLAAVKSGSPVGHGVTEGKRGTFSSGFRYSRGEQGPVSTYTLSDGSQVHMTPPQQKAFEAFIKKPKNGIVPAGFKVSSATDKPWYELPGIDREKLDDAARQFENARPDGSVLDGS